MEQWKDVPGFEYYQASNLGRIRTTHPKAKRKASDGILKPYVRGYARLSLFKDGKRHMTTVHSVIANCFLPPVEGKTEVDHINGVKTDNRVENLRWATRSEQNINKRYENKTGHRNISDSKDGWFRVKIYRDGKGQFANAKTLDEAIKVRDEMLAKLST